METTQLQLLYFGAVYRLTPSDARYCFDDECFIAPSNAPYVDPCLLSSTTADTAGGSPFWRIP